MVPCCVAVMLWELGPSHLLPEGLLWWEEPRESPTTRASWGRRKEGTSLRKPRLFSLLRTEGCVQVVQCPGDREGRWLSRQKAQHGQRPGAWREPGLLEEL